MEKVMLQRSVNIAGQSSLLIEIDQPASVGDLEYLCSFRFKIDEQIVRCESTYGIDPIQALMLAFDAIRNALNDSFPQATWFDLPIDLAFPRAIPYVAGIETYKALEKLVDQTLAAKFP